MTRERRKRRCKDLWKIVFLWSKSCSYVMTSFLCWPPKYHYPLNTSDQYPKEIMQHPQFVRPNMPKEGLVIIGVFAENKFPLWPNDRKKIAYSQGVVVGPSKSLDYPRQLAPAKLAGTRGQLPPRVRTEPDQTLSWRPPGPISYIWPGGP